MKKLTAFFCLLQLLNWQGTVFAQNQLKKNQSSSMISPLRKHEICSICSSYLANQVSIERGDVLVEIDEVFDTVNQRQRNKFHGLRVQETIKLRMIFDRPAKRLLLVRFHSISQQLYAEKEGGSDSHGSNEEISAVVLTEDECHGRTSPGQGFKYPNRQESEFDRILEIYRVPDFRQVGFTPFNALHRTKFPEFVGRIEMLASGSNLDEFSLQKTSGKSTLVFKIENSHEPDFIHYLETVFCTESLVPERIKLQGVETKEDGTSQSGFIYSEKIDWQDREGIYVPTKIWTEKPTRHKIGDDEFFDRTNATINFHWQSVNTPVDKSQFDSDAIYNLEKLTSLVVPEMLEEQSLKRKE